MTGERRPAAASLTRATLGPARCTAHGAAEVTYLDLEYCSGCSCDYLLLYTDNIEEPALPRLCGTIEPASPAWVPPPQSLHLYFKSDSSWPDYGFRVQYSLVAIGE